MITSEQIQGICEVLEKYPEVVYCFLFGSALRRFRENSDVDLLVG